MDLIIRPLTTLPLESSEVEIEEIDEVTTAYCYLVSQIGQPVARPQIIDVQLQMSDNQPTEKFQGRKEEIVRDRLAKVN